MSRSVWKGPYVKFCLINKAKEKHASGRKDPIKIWARGSTIIPEFVGLNFAIHNGKKFVPLYVTEEMVGMKFGEFSPTRTFTGHSGDRKTKKG